MRSLLLAFTLGGLLAAIIAAALGGDQSACPAGEWRWWRCNATIVQ